MGGLVGADELLGHALAEGVVPVAGVGHAAHVELHQPVAAVVDEAQGGAGPAVVESGVAAGAIGKALHGATVGQGQEAIARGVVGVDLRQATQAVDDGAARAIADGVVAVVDGAVKAGRLGKPVEAVVLEALVAGGVQQIGDGRDVVGVVIGQRQILHLGGAVTRRDRRQPIVLVVAVGQRDAVAEGQRGNRAEGLVGDIGGDHDRCGPGVRLGQDGGHPPQGITTVADDPPIGVDHLQQVAGDVEAVACGVDHAVDGAALLGEVAVVVIDQSGGSAAVGHGSQTAHAPVAKRLIVVAIGDVLRRGSRIAAGQRPVQGVVGEVRDDAAGVGLRNHVAAGVEHEDRRTGIRAVELDDIAEAVVGIGRHQAARVRHGCQVVLCVISIAGDAAQRVGLLHQAIEAVEGLGRHAA